MSFLNKIMLFTGLLTQGLNVLPASQIIPIVFHKDYDVSFYGLEKFHPFYTKKYGAIARQLQLSCGISSEEFQKPSRITDQELQTVHTAHYLEMLKDSAIVANIAEQQLLSYMPNSLLQNTILDSIRYATAGTVLGAQLAMKHGWAINLAGGYHHAKSHTGEGFCFFADIPLAIKKLRETNPSLKVLVVDLDAHQGNGLETIHGPDPLTYIFDMYSKNNYPRDVAVYKYIDFNFPLNDYIQDQEYLNILKTELPKAIATTQPDIIIYNAGTDIFEQDPIGKMRITKEGIIERDFFMFSQAFENETPILMVLSGGYSAENPRIISESIENILKKFKLISSSPLTKNNRPTKKLVKKTK